MIALQVTAPADLLATMASSAPHPAILSNRVYFRQRAPVTYVAVLISDTWFINIKDGQRTD